MTKEQILDIVVSNLKSLADTFPEDQRFEVNESTVLFGNEYGIDISLTDDRAMTREISPFDSVATLVDYIFEIINEKQNI